MLRKRGNMGRFNTKRGQITVFIIVGILILFIIGIAFIYRSTIIEDKYETARKVAEKIPLEFNPIKVYTEDCLKIVAEQGLIQLGQQGGYINPVQWHSLEFSLKAPTDSDGIAFDAEGPKIPYWIYSKPKNNQQTIGLTSLRPNVRDMEADIERWIVEEMNSCIKDYRPFTETGDYIESEKLEAHVTFVPGGVDVALEYPLTIKRGAITSTISHFFVQVPVDVLRLYNIATSITQAEQNFSFLERNTLNLITLFAGPTPDKLMPMTDTTFGIGNAMFWLKEDILSQLKILLANYVPLLRYRNALNFYEYRYPTKTENSDTTQRLYQEMVLPLEGAEGIEVRFNYLDAWEPYLDLNCEGELCQPQSIMVPLTFPPLGYFGVQRIKAVYDISYPVYISLYDPSAFDSQGYYFNFALEANIRNNRAAADGTLPPIVSSFKKSLFCERDHRNSGMIRVIVRDIFTKELIPNAQIAYALGDEDCNLGMTNNAGVFEEMFPIAVGGVVHALADGYLGSSRPLDPAFNTSQIVEIELFAYRSVNMTVEKKNVLKSTSVDAGPLSGSLTDDKSQFGDTSWSFHNVALPLEASETVLVHLKRVSEWDDAMEFAAVVEGDNSQEVLLPAGTYVANMRLLRDEPYTIPKEIRCEEQGAVFGVGPEQTCFKIPEITFQKLPNGGLALNATVPLTIEIEPFYTSTDLELYAVAIGLPETPRKKRVLEDIDQLNNFEIYSYSNYKELQPTYGGTS